MKELSITSRSGEQGQGMRDDAWAACGGLYVDPCHIPGKEQRMQFQCYVEYHVHVDVSVHIIRVLRVRLT